eukprot:1057980-Alexandrium_andersonii.AAC.1
MTLKPVESVDDLLSSSACDLFAQGVQAASGKESIEVYQARWETQKTLIGQIANSARAARNDLARE